MIRKEIKDFFGSTTMQQYETNQFFSILHVVAAAGFIKEVQWCFNLNKWACGDCRLWSLVINKQYVDAKYGRLLKTRLTKQCEVDRP